LVLSCEFAGHGWHIATAAANHKTSSRDPRRFMILAFGLTFGQ
jgi:hypothetical protein